MKTNSNPDRGPVVIDVGSRAPKGFALAIFAPPPCDDGGPAASTSPRVEARVASVHYKCGSCGGRMKLPKRYSGSPSCPICGQAFALLEAIPESPESV